MKKIYSPEDLPQDWPPDLSDIDKIVVTLIGIGCGIMFGVLRRFNVPMNIAIIIITISGISLAFYYMYSRNKRKKKLSNIFSELNNFAPYKKYVDVKNGISGIAYDKVQKSIALVKSSKGDIVCNKYHYKDILSAEVFVDGNSITKTSRSSQLGGALLGGLTFGPIGAVIGGLSGKQKTENTVSRVDLQVVVNDEENPRYIINFHSGEMPKNLAKRYINKAEDWKSLIEILIRKADKDDKR